MYCVCLRCSKVALTINALSLILPSFVNRFHELVFKLCVDLKVARFLATSAQQPSAESTKMGLMQSRISSASCVAHTQATLVSMPVSIQTDSPLSVAFAMPLVHHIFLERWADNDGASHQSLRLSDRLRC